MAIQIGAKPDSGFDDPLGMLTDCHRRIEHFLHILCIVADRAAARAMTDEEAAAVQASLQYFRVGGQRHNADEEQSLFPRLRAVCAAEDASEISGLESDHQEAGVLHAGIEELYESWIENGAMGVGDQERLSLMTQRLKDLYQQHIQLEEQVVFPRATKILDAKNVAAMGKEFRARRE